MEEKEYPKVSVLILAFDNPAFFTRSVKSVINNTFYENYEIVLIHNPCSNEEINNEIRKECNDFYQNHSLVSSYIFNEKNLYHGPGIMKGVEILTDPKYVLLLNDDIFVPGHQADYLQKMVDFLEQDESVASVTPSLYYPKETIYWAGKQDPSQPQHDFLHFPKGDFRLPTLPLKTCYNNMAFCLTRFSLLEKFPLGQSCPMYGSDSEFANRVKDVYPEMTHWVLPQIKLYHFNIYSLRTNRGQDPIIEG